eukprot:gene7566-8852_t
MSNQSQHSDIRFFLDLVKNAEPKEVGNALDYLNGLGAHGDVEGVMSENITLEDFKALDKLPELIEALWWRLTQPSELVQKSKNFFQMCIQLALRKISKKEFHSDYLKVLMNIFSPKPYQRDYRFNQDFQNDLPSKLSSTMVTYFAQQGGLPLIKNKIQEHKCSFDTLKKLLNTLKKLSKKMNVDESEADVEEFIKMVFHRLLATPDEEFKNESKKDLDFILKYLQSIANNIVEKPFTELFQSFALDISLKCFKSLSLEKRNAGLNDIIKFTKYESYMMYKPTPQYSPEKMVHWIKENKLVEQLYGETMHIQLLQKCTDILKFLAEKKAFERKYLDLMWNAAEGKHETIENVIYETIGNIAISLPTTDIDYLFGKIKEIPYEHYTNQTLHLISCLTQNRYHTDDGGYVPKGLEIFWELLQDENSDVPRELSHAAIGLFEEALGYYTQQRNEYLQKCINNLANHTSVLFSLRLIQYIITILSDHHKKSSMTSLRHEPPSASIIDQINHKMHLMELFFAHLEYYNRACKTLIEADGSKIMSIDDQQALGHCVLYGRQPHFEQIDNFLNFLSFIWDQNEPSNEDIDHLWEVFVISPVNPRDRDIFFKWIERVNMNEGFLVHILHQFDSIALNDLEPSGASLYIHCMKYVNQEKTTDSYVGVENLWRIALEAENDEVGREITSFLIELYKYITQTVNREKGDEFLSICMSKLARVPTGSSTLNSADSLLVNRTLVLVQTFLESFSSRSTDSFKKNFSPAITVTFNSQKHRVSMLVKSNETIGQIKMRLTKQIGAQPNTLFFFHNSKIMSNDWESLDDFKVNNHDIIMFNEMSEPRTMSHDEMPPINIHFDQSKFGLLFSLLSIEAIAPAVWEVLMLLPVHHQVYDALATLGSGSEDQAMSWESLLDHSSVFKLLYTLLIVDTFVQDSDNSYGWRAHFISTGGLSQLVRVLMHVDLQQESLGAKRNKCISLLLKIVTSMLIEENHNGAALVDLSIIQPPIPNFTPATFLDRLMELSWRQTLPTVQEEEMLIHHLTDDGEVINHIMTLISTLLAASTELLDQFCKKKDINKWISLLALESSDSSVREALYQRVGKIAALNLQAHQFFLQQYLDMLPMTVGSDKYSYSCSQYFYILQFLIKESCSVLINSGSNNSAAINQFSDLLHRVVAMLKKQPVVESTSQYQTDYVLVGLLNVINILVHCSTMFGVQQPEDFGPALINEIFHQCLFDIATADNHGPLCPPKCKTKESRDACFALLLALAKDNATNYTTIVELLIEQNKIDEKRIFWNYLPAGNDKSSVGYVGLKNLGATCYINSLMQQLFMIPAFRYSILQAEEAGGESQPDSLLLQLKIIFAHLQESEKKFHDPKDFCMAYKYDGAPINTSVQMDVDEFFNMLFDRLEQALKGTPHEKVLSQFFAGASVNQFISQECAHVSEKEEPFYTLSVEVKNKRDILESLQLFVESETLDGDNKYFCSTCNTKVKALMRRCVKALPNTLIIHNKRFEFDLDLMKRTKLNDQLRFPMDLDMAPYTKEHLEAKEAAEKAKSRGEPLPEFVPIHPASYYQYELSGILVHTGTADSGHYYSFIKERNPLIPGQPRRWIHFNDQLTEIFSPDDISKACFGGYDQLPSMDGKPSNIRSGPRHNNAYMLFYERVDHADAPAQHLAALTAAQASKLVPADIFNSVWKKNMKYLTDKNIFDPNYFHFIWNIIRLDSIASPAGALTSSMDEGVDGSHFDQTMMAIELGTRFVIDTLSHSKERKSLFDFIQHLCAMYEHHTGACRWLLDTIVSDSTWIRQNLLACITTEPRDALTKLLMHVINTLLNEERPIYFETVNDDNENIIVLQNAGAESPMDIVEIDDDMTAVSVSTGDATLGKNKAATQTVDELQLIGMPRYSKSAIIRFMDTYLEFIKEAPFFWKHFYQYFIFIRDFAFLGTEERKYLLSRNVISQLIDFYLGDESPNAKTHPPQKKTKMGDKYQQPLLTGMLETIAVLTRASHTRFSAREATLLPSHTERDPLIMSDVDTYMVNYPQFIVRTIKDNINLKSTIEILQHICYGDIDTSANMIQCIEPVDCKQSLDVLLMLISIDDIYQQERCGHAIRAYINILELNKTRSFVPHIKALLEVAAQNPTVGQWFEDNLDDWLIRWMVCYEAGEVRQDAYILIKNLFVGEDDEEDEERTNHLFEFLISNAKQVKKMVKREKETRNLTGKCEYYFKLLTLTSKSPEHHQIFSRAAGPILKMVQIFISNNVAIDKNRQESMKFVAKMVRSNEDNVQLVLKNPIQAKIMDYFISISPKEDLKTFNQRSLPFFYQLIMAMVKASPDFLNFVAGHSNFTWALNYLYLECGEYQEAAKVLFELTEYIVSKAPHHATRIMNVCLNFSNFAHYPTNCLPFLNLLTIRRAQAIIYFIGSKPQSGELYLPIEQLLKLLRPKAEPANVIKTIQLIHKILFVMRKEASPVVASNEPAQREESNINFWDSTFNPFKSVVMALFNASETSPAYVPHTLKSLNLIACEYPEGIINVFTDIFNKRIVNREQDNNSNNNMMIGQPNVFAQPQQYPAHHAPPVAMPVLMAPTVGVPTAPGVAAIAQQQQSPVMAVVPVGSAPPPVVISYEEFYKLLMDTVMIAIQNNPNANVQQKGIHVLLKITKEMILNGVESGYAALTQLVAKYSIKDDEKISILGVALKSPYTLLNPEFYTLVARFYAETEKVLSNESNQILAGLCRTLEDQISTSIASINSLGGIPVPSSMVPNDSVDIEQHLVELTQSIKTIEILNSSNNNKLTEQLIAPIIQMLQAFSTEIADDTLSGNAKTFKSKWLELPMIYGNALYLPPPNFELVWNLYATGYPRFSENNVTDYFLDRKLSDNQTMPKYGAQYIFNLSYKNDEYTGLVNYRAKDNSTSLALAWSPNTTAPFRFVPTNISVDSNQIDRFPTSYDEENGIYSVLFFEKIYSGENYIAQFNKSLVDETSQSPGKKTFKLVQFRAESLEYLTESGITTHNGDVYIACNSINHKMKLYKVDMDTSESTLVLSRPYPMRRTIRAHSNDYIVIHFEYASLTIYHIPSNTSTDYDFNLDVPIEENLVDLFISADVNIDAMFAPSNAKPFGGRDKSVLLKDVEVLTLYAGKMTTGSRSDPMPQITCVGGSARSEKELYPKIVQCHNMGSDGTDVQWKCESSLDSTVTFGKLDVSCEGYTYPEDPWILKGSCGLSYELEYTNPEMRRMKNEEYNQTSWTTIFIWVAIVAFIAYIILSPSQPQHGAAGPPPNGVGNGGAPGGYPPGPPGGGPPGGFGGNGGGYGGGNNGGADPNTYPGYPNINPGGCGQAPPGQAPGGWNPGFWTGAGLGYLFGRNRGYGGYGNGYAAGYGNGYGNGIGGSSWWGGRPNNSASPYRSSGSSGISMSSSFVGTVVGTVGVVVGVVGGVVGGLLGGLLGGGHGGCGCH